MKSLITGLLLGLALVSSPAFAITFTPSGTIVSVDYDEPTTNADATPLTDLKDTQVFYQFPGQLAVVCVTTLASSAGGGGHVTTTCTVPVGPNQEVDVTFTAIAHDISGNASVASTPFVIRIDRLPPAQIQ